MYCIPFCNVKGGRDKKLSNYINSAGMEGNTVFSLVEYLDWYYMYIFMYKN
jgi:hypothetical protein